MNPKRPRHEIEIPSISCSGVSGDYFEQVRSSTTPPVISSWLRTVKWIGMENVAENETHVSEEHIKMEIKTLEKQLLQVKRRLGPAAERCTTRAQRDCEEEKTTSRQEFIEARRACNPYESLGEGQSGGLNELFMNRSAIKLANIDALLGFCLTTLHGAETLVFADLCGAPGGFSEYIMRRCIASGGPACRGYGMSLVGSNEYGRGLDWKLDDFVHSEGGTDVSYRVCLGADGTGNIFNWDNVESLQTVIKEEALKDDSAGESDSNKVHLVVADGGFDAQRDAENQEGMTQKLIVCEVAAALALLKKGGIFAIKLFGFQTTIVQSVLLCLFRSFEHLVVVKPISSRPASAERYIVCTGFRGCPSGWNGPQWRDQIFLGKEAAEGSKLTTASLCFLRHLSEVDRDMLALNLKACYSVLSFLEAKCANGNSATSYAFAQQDRAVDVEDFTLAWNLL